MGNEGKQKRRTATRSGPQPGNFPLGSGKSRAAARDVLSKREAESQKNQVLLSVFRSGQELALDTDTCIQILRECGKLPKGKCGVVDFLDVPDGLSADELEKFLREHGAGIEPRTSD
jgi:hypothetical protein